MAEQPETQNYSGHAQRPRTNNEELDAIRREAEQDPASEQALVDFVTNHSSNMLRDSNASSLQSAQELNANIWRALQVTLHCSVPQAIRRLEGKCCTERSLLPMRAAEGYCSSYALCVISGCAKTATRLQGRGLPVTFW